MPSFDEVSEIGRGLFSFRGSLRLQVVEEQRTIIRSIITFRTIGNRCQKRFERLNFYNSVRSLFLSLILSKRKLSMMLTLPYHWTNVLIESQQKLQISRRTDFMPFHCRRQKFGSVLSLPMRTIFIRVYRAFGHVGIRFSLSFSFSFSHDSLNIFVFEAEDANS